MSHLLARIMLALLMLPLGALVYVVVFVGADKTGGGFSAFVMADVVSAAFVAAYWVLLWRKSVAWTSRRLGATAGAAVLAAIAGLAVGGWGASFDDEFGVFIGGVTAVLLWLVTTIFIWRETPAERQHRIRAAGPAAASAIVCPACGYNMTGLRDLACPECGARYAIDELLALQPRMAQGEVERGT
jgi:hypothetical protein